MSIEFEESENFVREQLESLKKGGIQAFGIQKEVEYEKKSSKVVSVIKDEEYPEALDIKNLLETKRPSSHIEIVTVFAYFLKKEGKTEFTVDDIRTCYKRTRIKPPKVIGQSLRDAKNNYDYISSGHKRGTYMITDHGESFVEYNLPKKVKK